MDSNSVSLQNRKLRQEKRFENGCPVPGVRENHCFKSIDEKRVRISRVSNDTASFITSVVQSADCPSVSINSIQPGDYIACVYYNKWRIGNISDTSLEERDAMVSFMHPHGPVYSFQWPLKGHLLNSRATDNRHFASSKCRFNKSEIQLPIRGVEKH